MGTDERDHGLNRGDHEREAQGEVTEFDEHGQSIEPWLARANGLRADVAGERARGACAPAAPASPAKTELVAKVVALQQPIVEAMARAYTRDRGFTDDGPEPDVAAVLVTATARMMTNPGQIARDSTAGPFSESIRGGFVGWSLAETFVLNRYRKRSL